MSITGKTVCRIYWSALCYLCNNSVSLKTFIKNIYFKTLKNFN